MYAEKKLEKFVNHRQKPGWLIKEGNAYMNNAVAKVVFIGVTSKVFCRQRRCLGTMERRNFQTIWPGNMSDICVLYLWPFISGNEDFIEIAKTQICLNKTNTFSKKFLISNSFLPSGTLAKRSTANDVANTLSVYPKADTSRHSNKICLRPKTSPSRPWE